MRATKSDRARRSADRLSFATLAGFAGVAGGLGWATLTLLTFAAGQGTSPLGYGTLDVLTPVALGLAAAGVAGVRARTRGAWSRLTAAGFVALAVGLFGAAAGSLLYVALGRLGGWTVSVWAYFLALVGATVFGVGVLWDGRRRSSGGLSFRAGAALLAGTLPVGVSASLALAYAGVAPDKTIVFVGPGVLLGVGIAILGWWTWRAEQRDERRTRDPEDQTENS